MNKRGQIYILVAILFGFTLFILTSKMNYAIEEPIEDDFKELSENYAIESSKFVNNLLERNIRGVADKFIGFSEDFSEFARNQNPDFGLIFLFPYKSSLYIGNYLDENIEVKERGLAPCRIEEGSISIDGMSSHVEFSTIGSKKCKMMTIFSDKLNVVVGDMEYDFRLNENVPEVIILSKEDKGKQRKVYMNKIIEGRKV